MHYRRLAFMTDVCLIKNTFLAGGGEMGQRMRDHDWAATALGPLQT